MSDVYWSPARTGIAVVISFLAIGSTTLYAVFWAEVVATTATVADCTLGIFAPPGFMPLVWGGHGSASARALTPLLTACNIALLMMGVMMGVWYALRKHVQRSSWSGVEKGVIQRVKAESVYKARHAFNFLFLSFITLGVYLSGFVLAVTGGPTARAPFSVLGCTDFPPINLWGLAWAGMAALGVATIMGHAMIPESPVGTAPISWNGNAADPLHIPISSREPNKPVIVVTLLLTLAAMALSGVAIGTYHDSLSLTADGGGHMCDCSGLPPGPTTVCNDARSALWYSTVGAGGGLWTTVGYVGLLLGVVLTMCGSFMGRGGMWTMINIPALRYIIISGIVVALVVLGYATGALWGAPSAQIAELCCPAGTCPTVASYTSGILLLLASISWCVAVMTGHYILKEPELDHLQAHKQREGGSTEDVMLLGREPFFDAVAGMRHR